MKKREGPQVEGALSAGGGGGGWMGGPRPTTAPKGKIAERMEARKAAAEAQPRPTAEESWTKFKTKNKIKGDGGLRFSKGGMVKRGQCRDYGK